MLSAAREARSDSPAESKHPYGTRNSRCGNTCGICGIPRCTTTRDAGSLPNASRSQALLRLHHGWSVRHVVRRVRREPAQAGLPAQIPSLRGIHIPVRSHAVVDCAMRIALRSRRSAQHDRRVQCYRLCLCRSGRALRLLGDGENRSGIQHGVEKVVDPFDLDVGAGVEQRRNQDRQVDREDHQGNPAS
jgi:hypothetical protein